MVQPAATTGSIDVWKFPRLQWVVLLLAVAASVAMFYPGLRFMVATWGAVEEYSYGYFIPFVSAFLIWQRSDILRQLELRGAWSGLWLLMLALLLGLLGEFSAVRLISQYGFIVAVFSLSVCSIGWRGTRVIAVPLAVLVFMIPLPQFLLRELSQQLQLVSSQIGVGLIRLFGISVFLEGNVIDLGGYKLQVADACSGLRYLFPLIVLGFLAAYFFNGALWKRVLITLSTIPLTIIINSLRIGLIGVTVEYWGSEMAEGLLHDFEGWFMFMICLALLVLEMKLLAWLGSRGNSAPAAFGLELPAPAASGASTAMRKLSWPLVAGCLAWCVSALVLFTMPAREELRPQRLSFDRFPLSFPEGWVGRSGTLARDVLAILAVDDHFIANYSRPGAAPVNLYVAYYDSQSSGQSTHSPRTCIPGDGWNITQLDLTWATVRGDVTRAVGGDTSVPINRAVIQKGEQRQLVYYWFQQRGRLLTDELSVKWFILRDGLVRNRSDGALVRLVTAVASTESVEQADARLIDFMAAVQPQLAAYVPN